jgi:hypothetical protein
MGLGASKLTFTRGDASRELDLSDSQVVLKGPGGEFLALEYGSFQLNAGADYLTVAPDGSYAVRGSYVIDPSLNASFEALALGGLVTNYNNVATAGHGVAAVYSVNRAQSQTASIGTTNLRVGGVKAPAGTYLLHFAITCKTTGSGTVSWTIGWTGNGQTKNVTGGPTSLNSSMQSSEIAAVYVIDTDGSADITFATTYASTGSYDVVAILGRLA